MAASCRARGRASANVRRLKPAEPPGRWHGAQCSNSTGARSFENVTRWFDERAEDAEDAVVCPCASIETIGPANTAATTILECIQRHIDSRFLIPDSRLKS